MDINDAACASGQARLNKSIVLLEVILVNVAAHDIVRKELPADRETEDIEAIVVNEVLHLSLTVVAVVCKQWRPSGARGASSVGVAPKVEACDVDSCEAEAAGAGWCSAARSGA